MTKNNSVARIAVYAMGSVRCIYYNVEQMISEIGIMLVFSKKQKCKSGKVSFELFKRLMVAMGSNVYIKHSNFVTK